MPRVYKKYASVVTLKQNGNTITIRSDVKAEARNVVSSKDIRYFSHRVENNMNRLFNMSAAFVQHLRYIQRRTNINLTENLIKQKYFEPMGLSYDHVIELVSIRVYNEDGVPVRIHGGNGEHV